MATPAAGSKTDPSQIDFHGEPFIVTQSSVGRTFDVAEAEKAWAAASYGDTVTIPMTVTKPEHTTEEINDMLFRDALSKNWTLVRLWNRDYCNEVRTSLSGSSADRISNVKKACELLDGLVLIPGQTLSFNDTLGERKAGFLSQMINYYKVEEGKFGYMPIYDSAQIMLKIASIGRDSLTKQKFAVYEILSND